jgi:type II secretion system (T2SS) protein M
VTPRDRRVLFLGASAIVAAVFVLRLLPWAVLSLVALRAEAAERVETLARADEVLAGAGATRDSLAEAFAAVVALGPRFVEGRTAADAQAALADFVSFTAGRLALRVLRLDPLPDSAAGPFGRVALHAELEGDVAGLTRFLKAVETGDPLLTVPALSVQAPDPVGRPNASEQLKIEATVAGFYLPRSGK